MLQGIGMVLLVIFVAWFLIKLAFGNTSAARKDVLDDESQLAQAQILAFSAVQLLPEIPRFYRSQDKRIREMARAFGFITKFRRLREKASVELKSKYPDIPFPTAQS